MNGKGVNIGAQLVGLGGERRDPMCGVYHLGNGYRAYSPNLMRFRCPDTMSPFGAGGINPYAYCAGDPVNRLDPSGHLSWQAWMGIGAGILGIGLAVFSAGTSIAAAGGVLAAIESASGVSLAAGVAGVGADVAAIASGALEDVNPKGSAMLGWASLASGTVGLVLGANALRNLASRYLSGPNSVAMGGPMRVVASPLPELYVFADNYKTARRLNIVAHSVGSGDDLRLLVSPHIAVNPPELASGLSNSTIDLPAYRDIRLISCRTAEGGANSFAQRLATHIGKPVKGYVNEVKIVRGQFNPSRFTSYIENIPTINVLPQYHDTYRLSTFNSTNQVFQIDKNAADFRSMRFEPLSIPSALTLTLRYRVP